VLLRRATGVLRDLERVLGAPIPLLKEIDAEVGS
jgi:hypothetical protein